jgi:hypothetical protein
MQYIQNKHAKYVINIFAMCDSKTFFTGRLEVYCEKKEDGPYLLSNKPSDIVNRLICDIERTGRNITFDNRYTSYPVAKSLLEKKITCTGTLKRGKREIPPKFRPNKSQELGTSNFVFHRDMTLISYMLKKNKTVILLSTMHYSSTTDENTKKPEIIANYSITKGGTDMIVQLCNAYNVARITCWWPMAMLYLMINIAGISAQILFVPI